MHCTMSRIAHGAQASVRSRTSRQPLAALQPSDPNAGLPDLPPAPRDIAAAASDRPAASRARSRRRHSPIWWLRFERVALTQLRHALLLTAFAMAAISLAAPGRTSITLPEAAGSPVAQSRPGMRAPHDVDNGAAGSAHDDGSGRPLRSGLRPQHPVRLVAWPLEIAARPDCRVAADAPVNTGSGRCGDTAAEASDVAVARP